MKLLKVLFFIVRLGPEEALKRIEHFSVDHLTGLYNRRGLKGLQGDLSVIFIDLDDFKKINDNFGYNAGDELLRKFSEILKGFSRSDDIFIRWGGDEFVLLLPRTNQKQAKKLVSRIKEKVKKEKLFLKFSYSITEKEKGEEKDLFLLVEKASKKMQEEKKKNKE